MFWTMLGNIPVTTTTKIFPKVLRYKWEVLQLYKWEAYCDTNGRSTDSISLSSERRGTKSTAIQIGGVLQYKWEVYCDTFLRSSGGWGFWHSYEMFGFMARAHTHTPHRGFTMIPIQDPSSQKKCLQNKGKTTKTSIGLFTEIGL